MPNRARIQEERRLEQVKRLEIMRKVQTEMVAALNSKIEEHGLSPSEIYWILATTMANLAGADLSEDIGEAE